MRTEPTVDPLATADRLESWKEVAAYLHRSERTVRRWERSEGLPVHRLQHDKRGSVYAYTHELDRWRESRGTLLSAESAEPAAPFEPARSWHRYATVAAAVVVVIFASTWWVVRQPAPAVDGPNPEAVRLVQRARFGDNAGRIQIETGIRTYRRAIEVDPDYALAWSGLATAHLANIWFSDVPVSDNVAQARDEAHEALRLDPSLGAPWRVLAFASHYADYDHAAAERSFRKAIELDPTDAVALTWFGDFHTDLLQFDEARQYYVRAQEVLPRWLSPLTFAANLHLFSGRPGMAIAEYERILEIEPSYGLANHFLGRAHLAAGHATEAVAQLRKSDQLLGGVPFTRADLGYALAAAGHRAEAERMLDDMMQRRSAGYYPAYPIAVIHLGLGRTEQAFDWMETAVDERNVGFYFPSVDPTFDPVRAHPRFRRILERLNVES